MEELGKELGNTSIFGEQKKEKSVIMEAEKKSPGKRGKGWAGRIQRQEHCKMK